MISLLCNNNPCYTNNLLYVVGITQMKSHRPTGVLPKYDYKPFNVKAYKWCCISTAYSLFVLKIHFEHAWETLRNVTAGGIYFHQRAASIKTAGFVWMRICWCCVCSTEQVGNACISSHNPKQRIQVQDSDVVLCSYKALTSKSQQYQPSNQ